MTQKLQYRIDKLLEPPAVKANKVRIIILFHEGEEYVIVGPAETSGQSIEEERRKKSQKDEGETRND